MSVGRIRIIPALAGNTWEMPVDATKKRDHPRSRGEYDHSSPPCCRVLGSSPLSRGIPCPPLNIGGNEPDHPRSRGEYTC